MEFERWSEVMRQARNQLERLGHCDHIGLDYYHFSEHVSEAAGACFGEGSQQAAAWRKRMLALALALETGVDELLDGIMQTCRQTRAPSKRDALRPLRNYIGERTAMIRYPQGGPKAGISAAARLQGSDRRWDPAGAHAMLHRTTLEDSNEWEAYWQLTSVHENQSHPLRRIAGCAQLRPAERPDHDNASRR